ncbi:MAG: hypothetical protein M1819_000569 [Sarea resinae]|nr:MAG: hypothetical protein M1819_000569 [Sarea resinae]
MSSPLIGTHNGHFHADEALAVHLLRHLPAYASSPLLRTRDPALLDTCHTVVDVGGAYDPAANRYDHHQRDFSATFPSHRTKLSSAGLVWLHFGKAIIRARCEGLESSTTTITTDDGDNHGSTTDDTTDDTTNDTTTLLWKKLYADFIEAIDANDNGIPNISPSDLAAASLSKRFHDTALTLPSLISDLNFAPPSSTSTPKPPTQLQAEEDARFQTASALIGTAFDRKLRIVHQAWLPARTTLRAAYDARTVPELLVLPAGGVPWKEHLYALEAGSSPTTTDTTTPGTTDTTTTKRVLYVLYPELPGGPPESKWRIQSVPVSADSFESRKPLPEQWRGLRDAELDRVAGVDGCVFVHASGFIGGNRTWDGVWEMARLALEL